MRWLSHAAAASLLLAACSPAHPARPPESAGARPTAPTLVRVVARDFAFDSSHTAPAGLLAIRLVNQGHAIHMLGIARLDSAKTLGDVVRALHGDAPIPWLHELGGPGVVSPGDSATAYLVLEPGTYSMICWWPDSAGTMHVMMGMMATLTVTGRDAGAPVPPPADVYVRESDYHIAMPDTLAAGRHVFTVANDGPHEHDLAIFRLRPGRTESQVEAWLAAPTLSAPPAEAVGGTVGQERWSHVEFDADLEPGRYLFLCLMEDATSPKPHYLRGMIRRVTVTAGR